MLIAAEEKALVQMWVMFLLVLMSHSDWLGTQGDPQSILKSFSASVVHARYQVICLLPWTNLALVHFLGYCEMSHILMDMV